MPTGTSLSRWTMSYFGAALCFLLLAQALLGMGLWAPSVEVTEPRALIVVHCVGIGWLTLLMTGALLQFVPVMTGCSLPAGRHDILGLGGIILGLALLLTGFDLLDTGSANAALAMAVAALILIFSLAGLGGALSVALWRGRRGHPAAPLVLVAIGCLAATVLLGSAFALTISGYARSELFAGLLASGAVFHAGFGLGGWMTLAAIGVSYKLLPMFLMSKDMPWSTQTKWAAGIAVLVLGAGALSASLWPALSAWLVPLAVIAFAVTIGIYLAGLAHAYRKRRRQELELNTAASRPAFVMLGVSVAMLAITTVFEADRAFTDAAAYLIAFGWLTGLGLAQLLKIVPFLTWMEAFGPLLGRRQTPRLADLVSSRAAVWLGAFYCSVAMAALAIAITADRLFQIAALGQFLSTAAIVVELALARSLANVDPAMKTAPFQKPALLFAANIGDPLNGSAS